MERKRISRWLLAAAILIPLAGYCALTVFPAYDHVVQGPAEHFYIVSLISVLAVVISTVVGIAGSRLRNIKIICLSLAYSSLALIFAVHGLSTPGFLLHASHLPGLSSQLSVLIAAFWIWVSSLPGDDAIIRRISRHPNIWLVLWPLGVFLLAVSALIDPGWSEALDLNKRPAVWIAAGLTIALNLVAMYRYWQSYRYSRFPLQAAIVLGSGWMIGAQWMMATGTMWHASWWLYHFLLLGSMLAVLGGLFKQYVEGVPIAQTVKALFTATPRERIEASLSPSIKQMIAETEARDPYTAGHNFRVATYALQLGEEMGLPPEHLSALAQGCVVHDLGKIRLPDAILNKPGKLTPEERRIIETHPVIGYDMCKRVGFMPEELQIIRSHHERWDGNGYPDRLKGEDIPLLARIAAVADVYDALTSTRAYRKAWSPEEALAFLREQKGKQFDPSCVDAWVKVCEREADRRSPAGEPESFSSPRLSET